MSEQHSRYSPKPVFSDPEQRQRVLDAVKANPKREDEGVSAFLRRTAISAGLIAADAREPGQEG